jgi:hypothetical protein
LYLYRDAISWPANMVSASTTVNSSPNIIKAAPAPGAVGKIIRDTGLVFAPPWALNAPLHIEAGCCASCRL